MTTETIAFELEGQQVELVPTLKAAKAINALCGGYMNAFRNLGNFDLDTVTSIVAAGLDKKVTEIEKAVFETGVGKLVGPCTEFVTLLSNGGKKPDAN